MAAAHLLGALPKLLPVLLAEVQWTPAPQAAKGPQRLTEGDATHDLGVHRQLLLGMDHGR